MKHVLFWEIESFGGCKKRKQSSINIFALFPIVFLPCSCYATQIISLGMYSRLCHPAKQG